MKKTISLAILQRCVFGFLLVVLGFRAYSHVLLSQLEQPVLQYSMVDVGFMLWHYIGIPQAIVGSPVISLIVDISLIGSALASFVWIKQRWFPRIFLVLFIIYFITYNSFGLHHTHSMIGILFILIPFCVSHKTTFNLLWEGVRYYGLWIYVSAFLWKLLRGSLFLSDQGMGVVLENQAAKIYYAPNSLLNNFLQSIINQPNLLEFFYLFAVSLQGVMLLGFFTKKWDRVLFVLPVLFHIGTWVFVDALFYELLILNFTLWWKGIE